MEIVIKSNSAYKYLWPIIDDLTRNINAKINVALNDSHTYNFNKNIRIINYDSKLNYTKRLVHILNQINTEYVLIMHDIDLILNLNTDKLQEYFRAVIKNNIDRLSLGVFDNPDDKIIHNNIEICSLHTKKSPHFFVPFDYAPSIYRRKKIIDFYDKFSHENYRTLEVNDEAVKYFNDNFKSYGIQYNKSLKVIYHRGYAFCEHFNFLHITVRGFLLDYDNYFDLKPQLLKFISKYKLQFLQPHKPSWKMKKVTFE